MKTDLKRKYRLSTQTDSLVIFAKSLGIIDLSNGSLNARFRISHRAPPRNRKREYGRLRVTS